MSNTGIIEEKAKWAPTMEGEFKKSVKLLPDEIIQSQERCILFGKFFRNPGIVALTNKRLIFLKHKVFGSDKMIYVPFPEITSVSYTSEEKIFLHCRTKSIFFTITTFERLVKSVVLGKGLLLNPTLSTRTLDFLELLKQRLNK